jgi:outer membrane protein TolC
MDLVKKFEALKSKLESTKLELAKAETNLDIVTKQREKALKELLDLTGASTLEEAIVKRDKLKGMIDSLIQEAEALLNE